MYSFWHKLTEQRIPHAGQQINKNAKITTFTCGFTARLMELLKPAKEKGTILTDLRKTERVDLLIPDDFAMQPFDATAGMKLLDVIEERHGKKSTIITSQIPVNE